ncbi:MAG: FAD:protein FMN transferase [Bacteroidales bacterium]|jgi:thiamine biosynthesis lipoprotein|nr:FAD:protein FMN transferase [Bacteroidales bacterium]
MKHLIFLLPILLVSCAEQPSLVRFSGQAQGTYYTISYYDEDGTNYQSQVDSILDAFNFVASLHEPQSEICAVNNNDDIVVSPMFQDLFRKAVSISEVSDGAYDFTIGPLVKAYGFWNKQREDITDAKIAEYLQYVDYSGIQLIDGKIVKADTNMKFDFNSIAKGYSVDIVGQFLESKGLETYLVDIGGEVLGKGLKPNGDKWRVGIEEPAKTDVSDRKVETVLELHNLALATSGTYRKYYEKDGRRYSHTIDPTTGKSVEHTLLSVTVRDTATWRADGLATAMMVLGVEKSLKMLEKLPGVEAYFISACADSTFVTVKSKGF